MRCLIQTGICNNACDANWLASPSSHSEEKQITWGKHDAFSHSGFVAGA